MWDDAVVAYAADGRELFRTKVEEPVLERPAIHQNTI
jgi:hypothetical protein